MDNVLPTGCESALGPTRGRRIQASGVYLLYLGMGYDILCIHTVVCGSVCAHIFHRGELPNR